VGPDGLAGGRAPEPEGPPTAEQRYQAARQRATALQGFYIHLFIYVIVNAGLFLLNLFTRSEGGGWWFFWPLAAWGVALLIHAATTFVGVFSPEWVERRARRLIEQDERRNRA
jgi:hypothetical protein